MNAFELSDEIVETMASLRPIGATFQGVAGHDAEWDDLSPAAVPRAVEILSSFRTRLLELPDSTDRWELLARTVAREYLDLELERYAHGDHLVDLNNVASPFQMIRMVFDVMETKSTAGWENLVERLATIDRVCDGYRAALDAGRGGGQAVARRQVAAAIVQGRVHAGERSYFRRLPAALDSSGISASPALRAKLAAGVEHACRSYGALTDWLETTYLPAARQSDAFGREQYLRHAKKFLGMEIDPEETYAWGWTEVAAIGAEMREVAAEIRPGASVAEVLELLRTDPARGAPSHQAFLETMRERQVRAAAAIEAYFDIPDAVRVIEVELSPPGGMLGAYYVPPSDGFRRQGTVWYSLDERAHIPLYDEIGVAYHEGFPGHHLQCGIQVWLTDRLSRLHRGGEGYSGYAEGWALYAERLMQELGMYEKPDYVLGMLANQMMRACRVVVDIGSHLELAIPEDQSFHPGERWSFELGVELLTSSAGADLDHAKSEMTRYLGWPGQAIGYKVGERIILALREELRRRRGAAFDLKDFHARVLGSGPVSLSALREIVLGRAAPD